MEAAEVEANAAESMDVDVDVEAVVVAKESHRSLSWLKEQGRWHWMLG